MEIFEKEVGGKIYVFQRCNGSSTLSKIDPFMLTKIAPLTARVLAAV
jgi:hypothetical protein